MKLNIITLGVGDMYNCAGVCGNYRYPTKLLVYNRHCIKVLTP